jgi:predicted GNAT superfamily acetyltransferase
MSGFAIRTLSGMDEFLAAENLQRTVWGEGDTADPGDLMMVIQHEGGLVAGAFDGPDIVGYVFGFPTRDPKVQHSHRLAVHPRARGHGLAARLKFFQRGWCLEHGIELVRWTFDPLRHTNAHLNTGRLGARVSTYFADYYGEMKGINAGLPSDRLLAEWHLAEPHVDRLAGGIGSGVMVAAQETEVAMTVRIPANLDALFAEEPGQALSERLRVRQELTHAFARGYEISGYDAGERSYLLRRKPG